MPKKPNPLAKIRTYKNKQDQFELVDYDYLSKLSPEEQEWLATFTESHYEGKGSGRGKRRNDCYSMCTRAPLPECSGPNPEEILAILETIKK